MSWPTFLLFNALGGIVWATIYGVGGYLLGSAVDRIAGPVKIGSLVIAGVIMAAGFIFLKRNERKLTDEAELALPGSLDQLVSQEERRIGGQ
jgi:membrane protein DedA with SNARE-associated domain